MSIPQLEEDGYVVDYNTNREWVVITPNGKEIVFQRDKGLCNRIPYIDMRDHKEAFVLVQTVCANFGGFTKRQIEAAVLACKAQARMGHHANPTFKLLVSSLKNFPVKPADITNASVIFGPYLKGLRGITVRQRPERVENEYIQIPRDFYELNRFVTLTVDVMFVNRVAFLTTLLRGIRLFTAEYIPSCLAKQLSSSLKQVIKFYTRGGFMVQCVMMDMEFEPVTHELDLAEVNTTAAREHVGEIKRGIRTIKERARCSLLVLPFKHIPRQMTIHLIYFGVMWPNAVPSNLDVSQMYSPREIVTQRKLDCTKHCKVELGAYVEASTDRETTNDMVSRKHECIVLGPSTNLQGSLTYFDINTGKVVKRHTITVKCLCRTV